MFRVYWDDWSFADYEQPEEVTKRSLIMGFVFADPISAPDPRTRGRIVLTMAEWYIWPTGWDAWYPVRSEHDVIIDWLLWKGPQSLRNAVKGVTMMDEEYNRLWKHMCEVEIPGVPPKSSFVPKAEQGKR
jgi:hypothetical protein